MKEGVTVEQQRKMAVAFLIRNEGDQPEGTETIFGKLMNHERDAGAINQQIEQAKKAVQELSAKLDYKVGSIEAVADILADMLPEDDVEGWADAYEALQSSQQQPTEAPVEVAPEEDSKEE